MNSYHVEQQMCPKTFERNNEQNSNRWPIRQRYGMSHCHHKCSSGNRIQNYHLILRFLRKPHQPNPIMSWIEQNVTHTFTSISVFSHDVQASPAMLPPYRWAPQHLHTSPWPCKKCQMSCPVWIRWATPTTDSSAPSIMLSVYQIRTAPRSLHSHGQFCWWASRI